MGMSLSANTSGDLHPALIATSATTDETQAHAKDAIASLLALSIPDPQLIQQLPGILTFPVHVELHTFPQMTRSAQSLDQGIHIRAELARKNVIREVHPPPLVAIPRDIGREEID